MNGKLFLGIFCLLLVGCNPAADDLSLTSVSGTVTYQGEPVREGVIRLTPAAGSQAPARTTQIKAGQYQFAERSAVKAGTYQVEINAYRGGSGLPGDRTEDSPEREQFLPEKFNTKTEIEAFTVKPGESAIQQDFNLK